MSNETGLETMELHLVGADVLHKYWGGYLALGVLLVMLGTIAIGSSFLFTIASVMLFGWLLIIGGACSAGHAFWRKRWGGFFVDLLTGILYLVVGFMMVANTEQSAVTITLLIAMFLIFGGVFRIFAGLSVRLPHRGWIVLNGIICLLLGISIWKSWPWSGFWVIGLFIGIEMIFNGYTLIMLSLAVRKPATAA